MAEDASHEAVAVDIVGEVVCRRAAANRVEQQHAYRHAEQDPPRRVAQQRPDVASHARLLLDACVAAVDVDALARQQERQQEEAEAYRRDDYHRRLPCRRVGGHVQSPLRGCRGVVAEQPAERLEHRHGDEAAAVGEEHAVGREYVALPLVGAHHAQHGAVGHVYGRVDGHHEDVGAVCPHQLARIAECRRSECQHARHGERQRHPQQIGAVLAPARLGAVGQNAHQRIRYGVPQLGYQQQPAGIGERQPEDVRVEERQIVGKYLPEHRRGQVAESVAYFFAQPCHYFPRFLSIISTIVLTEAPVVRPSAGVLRQ